MTHPAACRLGGWLHSGSLALASVPPAPQTASIHPSIRWRGCASRGTRNVTFLNDTNHVTFLMSRDTPIPLRNTRWTAWITVVDPPFASIQQVVVEIVHQQRLQACTGILVVSDIQRLAVVLIIACRCRDHHSLGTINLTVVHTENAEGGRRLPCENRDSRWDRYLARVAAFQGNNCRSFQKFCDSYLAS